MGYPVHRCRDCGKTFNERTGTPFDFIEVQQRAFDCRHGFSRALRLSDLAIGGVYTCLRSAIPTDIVFQVVYFRYLVRSLFGEYSPNEHRYRLKLSYRDLAEMFLIRGFTFSHETVRDWAERFGPIFTDRLRQKRRHKIGHTWFVDETYVKIGGRWCYLYRGIDEYGNLVDVFLSEHRDMAAAKAFFQKAFDLLQTIPERVITDGHKPYPRAVEKVLGQEVEHQVSRCMDNPIEQSHRKIEQRYYPTLGFGEFESAQHFCQTVEELNQFLRPRQRLGEFVSLSKVREHTRRRVAELREIVKAA